MTSKEGSEPPQFVIKSPSQTTTSSRATKLRTFARSSPLGQSQSPDPSISSLIPLTPESSSSIAPVGFYDNDPNDATSPPWRNDSVPPSEPKATSPRDTLVKMRLSPSADSPSSLSGRSFFSTDTASYGSFSSSGLLTPPSFQGDFDNPPYKAGAEGEQSLTMSRWRSNRLKSLHGKEHSTSHELPYNLRNSHTKRYLDHIGTPRKCRRTHFIAPTASNQMKDLNQNHIGSRRSKSSGRNSDTPGKLKMRTKSDQLAPVLSRRWSSVEIGTHRTRLQSILPKRSSGKITLHSSGEDRPPYRSSSFTPGAKNHDILRTVRDKLTLRKIPEEEQLETPATITLRRASGISPISAGGAHAGKTKTDGLESTSQSRMRDSRRQSPEELFLITTKDVDSITALIEKNLSRNSQSHSKANKIPRSEVLQSDMSARTGTGIDNVTAASRPQLKKTSKANSRCFSGEYCSAGVSNVPHFTHKGMVPSPSPPTQSAFEAAEVQLPNSTDMVDSHGFLEIVKPCHRLRRSDGKGIWNRSNHEVIWEAGESRPSVVAWDDVSDSSSEHEGPVTSSRHVVARDWHARTSSIDRGDAFDPGNARNSISEWSMNLPEPQVQVIASSESEPSEISEPLQLPARKPITQADLVIPSLRVTRTDTDARRASQINSMRSFSSTTPEDPKDVVSFPPLSARPTSDWISPLPSIKIATPSGSVSSRLNSEDPNELPRRTLHDEGIDATDCVREEIDDFENKWQSFTDLPTSPSFKFNPEYQIRRKSAVRMHPKAAARIGSLSSYGSSLGASSGARRKSPTKIEQTESTHTECVDNINRPSNSRTGTWSKARPPTPKIGSIAISPSPEESSGDDSPGYGSPARNIVRGGHSGQVERMDRIQDTSPPASGPDFAGIHEMMTGAKQGGVDRGCIGRDCRKRQCCGQDSRRISSIPSVDWIG